MTKVKLPRIIPIPKVGGVNQRHNKKMEGIALKNGTGRWV